jgi:predicted heme/steroid binding protein/uncharacterized membrane protein
MKEFTSQELARFNGDDEESIYIAHKGKVYDVSESKLWKGGMHMKRHKAGSDLSSDIQAAPHEQDVLERYPQVGTLRKEKEPEAAEEMRIPEFLSRLLARFPMLRRHPHPMTVHFPIAFMIASPLFLLLYLMTGVDSFDTTVFHCLGAGVLFGLVAIGTGWYTWWLNYMAADLFPVRVKKRLSVVLAAVAAFAFLMRASVPDILVELRAASAVYIVLVLSLFPIVTVIGWYGAALTFPVEKE